MDTQTLVIVVGLILGAVLVLAAVVVGIKKQGFAYGEILITAFGVVLVGLSLWSRVSLELGQFRAEFESLKEGVQEVAEAAAVVSAEVIKLDKAATTQRDQVAILVRSLKPQTLDPGTRATVQRELEAAPRIDPTRLSAAVQRLNLSAEAVARMRAKPPG